MCSFQEVVFISKAEPADKNDVLISSFIRLINDSISQTHHDSFYCDYGKTQRWGDICINF